jgi:hypothetical protein
MIRAAAEALAAAQKSTKGDGDVAVGFDRQR